MNVTLDNLTTKITESVETYQKEIMDKLLASLKDATEKTLKQVEITAPVSNRNDVHLKDTFTYQKTGDETNTKYQIYSKNKQYLVHILEFGFNSVRGGRFVQGQPFMIPALNYGSKLLSDDIKKILK